MANLIEVKNLSAGYDGIKAFENVSFTVAEGSALAVVGENGSGKSTLISCLLGLKKPDGGEIKLCGVERRDIGVLLQNAVPRSDFPASVLEVVRSGCLNRSKPPFRFLSRSDKARAGAAMEQMGITDLAGRHFSELSGGQRQRVLIARAVCAADRLLVLDEPLAGLDPLIQSEFYDIIDRINADGMTVIMVSHDVAMACAHADSILHVSGSGSFFGSSDDYKKTLMYAHMTGISRHVISQSPYPKRRREEEEGQP